MRGEVKAAEAIDLDQQLALVGRVGIAGDIRLNQRLGGVAGGFFDRLPAALEVGQILLQSLDAGKGLSLPPQLRQPFRQHVGAEGQRRLARRRCLV